MTLGLLIGYVLAGFSAILFALGACVGNQWAARASLAILGAYIAVHIVKLHIPISRELMLLIFAAIWVTASCFVPLGGSGDKMAPLFVRAFMALSGACYLWARLTDAPRVFGSPPYVASDMLLIAAMLLIGWTLRHDIHRISADAGGGGLLGRYHGGGGVGSGNPVSSAQVQAQKGAE